MGYHTHKEVSMAVRNAGIVVMLVFLLAPFALAGGAQEAASDDERVTVTWGYWGSPSEVEQNERIAAAFEEQNPDIRVEHMTAPWGDYFTRLQTQFASESAPDVMFLTFISRYAPSDVLHEMTPLFERYGFDESAYTEEMLQAFTVNGKLYGVPRDNDTKVIYFNKTLFDEAGLSYPSPDWTTDEFVETAQALTRERGDGSRQFGFAFDPGNWYVAVNMNHAPLFDDPHDPTEVALDHPDTIEALSFLGDLINEHEVTPSYDQMSDTTIRIQQFMGGRVAMLMDNHARIPEFLASDDLDWDVAHLPQFPGKPKGNVIGGAGYTIYSKTDKIDAAWRLWEFLNTDALEMFMEEGRGTIVPANLDILDSDEFVADQPFNQQVFVDETRAGIALPPNVHWWNVYGKANPFLENIWVGRMSAEEAVRQAIPVLNRELED
jgi:multiple sugar transport system substrate-binding protein